MNSELYRLSERIQRTLGRKKEREENLERLQRKINRTKREGWAIEEAREIVHAIALETQKEVQFCLEEAGTHSLRSVFEEPYNFHVDFEIKRQRTEALLRVSLAGEKISPKDSSGGGVIDILSFTLKVLLWNLSRRPSAPVLILDEPFRFVSTDLQPKVGELLQEIQRGMGIQFLIITHEEELMDCADLIYKISRQKGKSIVEEM